MIQLLPDPILSLLYPQACDVCDREVGRYRDGTACSDCWNSTRVFNGNETLCTKCGAFLFGVPSRKEMYCEACTEHFYDHAIAIGIYEKALAASVLRLKRIPFVPARLKGLIVEQARQSLLTAPTIVVPVPLSPRRYQERGFNQASVIAKLVAKHKRTAFLETALTRQIHTPVHRAGMDKKARAMTVKNAFVVELTRRADAAMLAGSEGAADEPVHDRLHDALMRRLDALLPKGIQHRLRG